MVQQKGGRRRRRRKHQRGGGQIPVYKPKRQKGGILPFLIPLLIAGAKAAAVGGIGAAAGHGVKKAWRGR